MNEGHPTGRCATCGEIGFWARPGRSQGRNGALQPGAWKHRRFVVGPGGRVMELHFGHAFILEAGDARP